MLGSVVVLRAPILMRRRRAQGAAARCDRVLDLAVLAFAAWTAIYDACLVLHLRAEWAVAAEVVALGPCLALAFGGGANGEAPARGSPPAGRGRVRVPILAGATVTAATAFAFLHVAWPVVVGAWLVASAAALACASGRDGVAGAGGTAVALAWAVALAVLSLFLVNPNADDSQYVHLSSWVAAHGSFPVGDTLFSDQALPAIFYPPLSSYEALVGAFARTTELPAPAVVYFSAAPVAAALSVLALWRLLRRWRVRAPATALTVAIGFLLLDAAGTRTFGSFWLARIWQGKVIFVAVLVPLLVALLVEYAERPSRRGAILLAAAGVAAVGLTTTAMFVVPVIAAGCMLPLLPAARWRAAAGLAVTVAYPLAAGAFTLAVGGRNPQVYTAAEVVPRALAHDVLGRGALAFVAVAAVLAGPALIRSAAGARMAAGLALSAGLLFVPGVTLAIFRLTGLGEVLWRLSWVLPVAALVGVLGSEALQGARWPAARVLPALAVGAALLAWGTPLWSATAGTRVAETPQWKLSRHELAATRRVLAVAHPGDVILAPRPLSQALLKRSGAIVVVDPADRYVRALDADRAALGGVRILLENFASHGLATLERPGHGAATERLLALALRRLHVDLACVRPAEHRARRLLRGQGFTAVVAMRSISCLSAAAMISAHAQPPVDRAVGRGRDRRLRR